MTTYLAKKNSTVRFQRSRERAFELLISNLEELPALVTVIVFAGIVLCLLFGMAK